MNKYQEPEVPKIGILLTEMGRISTLYMYMLYIGRLQKNGSTTPSL